MYGYLISRVAHAHPNGGQYDVTMAFGETQRALRREAAKPGKDFGELVRERRRRFGLPNRPAEKVLPFWLCPSPGSPSGGVSGAASEASDKAASKGQLTLAAAGPVPKVAVRARAAEPDHPALALRSAEVRMREALDALDSAAQHDAKPQELAELEAAFASAEAAYLAAIQGNQAE